MSFVLVSGVDVCGITRECDGSMVFRKGVHRYQVVLNIWSDDSVSYIQRHCRSVDLLVADVCDGVRCVSSCSCKAGATYWFGCAACVFEMRGMCARIEDVTRTLCGRVGYGVYGRGAMGSIVGYGVDVVSWFCSGWIWMCFMWVLCVRCALHSLSLWVVELWKVHHFCCW